jgi:hypothetical protein
MGLSQMNQMNHTKIEKKFKQQEKRQGKAQTFRSE